MKNRFFLIFGCGVFLSLVSARAQVGTEPKKTAVAVLPLDAVTLTTDAGATATTDPSGMPELKPFDDRSAVLKFSETATQKVVNALSKVKRIRIVERAMMDRILTEQNFQMTDMAETNETVRMGALLGAQYIIVGQLQQVATNRIATDSWGNPTTEPQYDGTVEFNLRLIDVSTGEVTASKDFKGRTGFLYQKSPAESAYWALNQAEKDVDDWMRSVFPIEGYILEIRKEKKGEAQEVVITCGSSQGIRKDDVFKVFVETEVEVDGRMLKRSSDVGKLIVTKIEADGNFSRCEVGKGGKEMVKNLKAGVKMKVVQVKK